MGDLILRDLGRAYRTGDRTVEAVKGLSLRVAKGSFAVVVGASGCGKSTLLKLIAGLERPDAGEVQYGDEAERVAGSGKRPRFGFMFQDARLLPWLTVEANLRLAFPGKCPEAETELRRALDLVGLGDWLAAYPRQLSGGMAQRAALARALCRRPDVLLLDEPLGALDAMTRSKLRKDLGDLWRKLGITVVLVTHDIEEAVYLADRVVVMKKGAVSRDFEVPLRRPRNPRSEAFQRQCGFIEEAMEGSAGN